MDNLSQDDLDRLARALAPQIVAAIRESQPDTRNPDFRISPEQHYKAHIVMDKLADCLDGETLQTLRELLRAYRKGRSLFFVSFIGLMISGALGLVAVALGMKMPWK